MRLPAFCPSAYIEGGNTIDCTVSLNEYKVCFRSSDTEYVFHNMKTSQYDKVS